MQLEGRAWGGGGVSGVGSVTGEENAWSVMEVSGKHACHTDAFNPAQCRDLGARCLRDAQWAFVATHSLLERFVCL